MKKDSLLNKIQVSTGIILGLSFVIVLTFFLIGPAIDRMICYERVSNELGVPSTSSAIRKALYSGLSSKVQIGFTYDQTLSALESNWSYKIIWKRPNLGGGFKEYLSLDQCFFSRNDFTYLLVFSKDGNLENILNYIDD